MTDDVKEAVAYMSEALKALLSLCDDFVEPDSEIAGSLEEIRDAKTHYEDVLRAEGLLPPLADEEPKGEDLFAEAPGSKPLDLVSLAEQMSSDPASDPAADAHQDGQ